MTMDLLFSGAPYRYLHNNQFTTLPVGVFDNNTRMQYL